MSLGADVVVAVAWCIDVGALTSAGHAAVVLGPDCVVLCEPSV